MQLANLSSQARDRTWATKVKALSPNHWATCELLDTVYFLSDFCSLHKPVNNDRFQVEIQSFLGEGNGNPFQYSCLENPVDRGAWWAADHKVT